VIATTAIELERFAPRQWPTRRRTGDRGSHIRNRRIAFSWAAGCAATEHGKSPGAAPSGAALRSGDAPTPDS
jgi:hypothetical protein